MYAKSSDLGAVLGTCVVDECMARAAQLTASGSSLMNVLEERCLFITSSRHEHCISQQSPQVVQIIGSQGSPENIGKTGTVQLVQARKCCVTECKAYQASVSLASSSKKVILR